MNNVNNVQEKASYRQKLAGVLRYLSILNQTSEDNFNKVMIRLHIHALKSFNNTYAELLSALLTFYAQDSAHSRPKVAAVNSHVNWYLMLYNKLFLVPIVIPVVITFGLLGFQPISMSDLESPGMTGYGAFTLSGMFTMLLVGVAGYVVERLAILFVLLRIERNLYHGRTPTSIMQPKLRLQNTLIPAIFHSLESLHEESRLSFMLSNVPPYTINDTHAQSMAQLFPLLQRNIQYQLSSNYHLITPYPQANFQTKQDIEKLLTYLGVSVKHSAVPYTDMFDGWLY